MLCVGAVSASSDADSIGDSEDSSILKMVEVVSAPDSAVENEIVSSGHAEDTLSVNNNSDVLGSQGTYSELANEIATGGVTVELKHSLYTYDSGAPAITITGNNRVIDGKGAVIDMAGSSIKAFHAEASYVTFKNLTIINAHDSAIYIKYGTVTNCNFENNSAINGGGLYIDYYANVTNCRFVDNYAASCGGAIYFHGFESGSGSITNCNFIHNTAYEGGAIYIDDPGNVINCDFTNNLAYYRGGAVYMSKDGEIINSNFVNNRVLNDEGGAIFIFHSFSSVVNCSFAYNGGGNYRNIYSHHNEGSYTLKDNKFLDTIITLNNHYYDYGDGLVVSGTIDYGVNSDIDNLIFKFNDTLSHTFISNVGLNKNFRFYVDPYVLNLGTYNLTTTTDNNNNKYTASETVIVDVFGDFNLLQMLINGASENGVINLEHNYTYDIGVDTITEGIIINKTSLTIDGHGYTIDAKSMSRIFNVNASNVVLKNIILINGKSVDYGGAVYFNDVGSVLNCHFVNNHGSYGGGVSFISSGNVTNCNFVNNTASEWGGAVYMISVSGSEISKCIFENNTANRAGAVYMSSGGSVVDCSFVNNTAIYGGAVYMSDDDVINCSFVNNHGSYGRNIFTSSTTHRIIDNSFLDTIITLNNHYYDYDDGLIVSGTIDYGVNSDIDNLIFKFNDTLSHTFISNVDINQNFRFYVDPYVLNLGTYNITVTTDDNNNKYMLTNSETFTVGVFTDFELLQLLVDCASENGVINLEHNYTYDIGVDTITEGIIVDKASLTIDGHGYTIDAKSMSRIFNATAYNVVLKNIILINGKANDGGAVYMPHGSVVNCSFVNNTASYDGGAVYFSAFGSSVNCSFVNNTASNSGGAVYLAAGSVINCSFLNNHGSYERNIYLSGTQPTIINNSFLDITLTLNNKKFYYGRAFTVNGTIDYGVNLKIDNLILKVNDTAGHPFTTNVSKNGVFSFDVGAGELAVGTYNISTTTDMNNNKYRLTTSETFTVVPPGDFESLQQLVDGASENSVINLERDYTYTIGLDTITEGIIVNKRNLTIDGHGYTIDAKSMSRIFKVVVGGVTLNNIIFSNGNSSSPSTTVHYNDGGAVHFTGISVDGAVTNCNFTNNLACDGGALYMFSGTVENCNFINNLASSNRGGAIYFSSSGSVLNCNFTNNNASYCGGAISMYSGTVENCNFTHNLASDMGGAIYFNQQSNVLNCNFTNNNASRGGAVFVSHSNVSNCNFVNNTASYGGAIYSLDVNVNHSTFNNNIGISGARNIQITEGLNMKSNRFLDVIITLDHINNNYGDDLTLSGSVDAGVNYQINALTFKINDTAAHTYTSDVGTDAAFSFVVEGGQLAAGSYNVTATRDADDNIYILNANNFLVSKKEITLDNVDSVISTYGNATITITGNLTNSQRVNYTGKISLYIGNHLIENTTVTVENCNFAAVFNDGGQLAPSGDAYSVSIVDNNLNPNFTITSTTKPNIVLVNKAGSDVVVPASTSVNYGGSVVVRVSGLVNATGVSAKLYNAGGAEVGSVSVSGYNITVDVAGLDASTYTLNVTTLVDSNHTSVTKSGDIVIIKLNPVINVASNDVTYPSDVIVTVTSNAEGIYSIGISDKIKYFYLDANTPSDVPISGLGVNEEGYTIVVSFEGNDKYAPAVNDKVKVKVLHNDTPPVPKATVLGATASVTDSTAVISITLSDVDGNKLTKLVNVKVGDKVADVNVIDGVGSLTLSDLAVGTHTAYVTFMGDDSYAGSSASVSFDIKPKAPVETVMTATADVNYKDVAINITLASIDGVKLTRVVSVRVGNLAVDVDVRDGVGSLVLSDWKVGNYTANAVFAGDEFYASSSASADFAIEGATIIADNIKRGVNSPYDYYATLVDSNGKPLAGKEITFTIDGKTLNATTDEEGIARVSANLTLVNDTDTVYSVVVINPDTGANITATTTIVPRIIVVSGDLSGDYLANPPYVVQAIGDDGNPVGENETVRVVFAGFYYDLKTNATGHVVRTIGLAPGLYAVKACYNGYNSTQTVFVVNQILKVTSGILKKTAKYYILKATLKSSKGKPLANKQVKLLLKGKLYKVFTNSKGVASKKISSSVIKTLKPGKTYTLQARYVNDIAKGKIKVVKK